MKKYCKFLSILTIVCALTVTFNGCGDQTANTTTSTQNETVETDHLETEISESTQESVDDVLVEVPNEVDAMRPILKGLCKNLARGKAYDSADVSFYWESLYASINGNTWIHPDIRLADNGAGYMVPKSVMEEYAAAMFANYTELPELPSGLGSIEYDAEEKEYLLYSAGGLTGNMDIMAVDETEEGYNVSVAFHMKKDAVENYTFVLINKGFGSFPCTVQGLVE